jgi:uncharacterized protein YjiS (DUF1127 family)
MKAVTLTAPSYNELKSLFILRSLYVPKEVKLSPTQYTELCKRFIKGYEKLKENEDIKSALLKVNEYARQLDDLGIRDSDVKSENFNHAWIIKENLFNFFLVILYIIITLPAFILLSPFALIVQNVAEKERIAVNKYKNIIHFFNIKQERKYFLKFILISNIIYIYVIFI